MSTSRKWFVVMVAVVLLTGCAGAPSNQQYANELARINQEIAIVNAENAALEAIIRQDDALWAVRIAEAIASRDIRVKLITHDAQCVGRTPYSSLKVFASFYREFPQTMTRAYQNTCQRLLALEAESRRGGKGTEKRK